MNEQTTNKQTNRNNRQKKKNIEIQTMLDN
jgi:hypothetical protein